MDIKNRLQSEILTKKLKIKQQKSQEIQLNEEKYELGEDFSYGEIDGIPSLWIKSCYLEKIKNIYDLSSWKQCEPYIKVLEKS